MNQPHISFDVIEDAAKGTSQISRSGAAHLNINKQISKYPDPQGEIYTAKHANWGRNDQLPTEIRCAIERVPMAGAAVAKLSKMMYGEGLYYYSDQEFVETGNIRKAHNPEVEAFLRRNFIHTRFIPQQIMNYRLYMNTFSEIGLSRDFKKITNLYAHHAEYARLSKRNDKNYRVEHLYLSADFINATLSHDKRRYRRLALFDWTESERFMRDLRSYRFAWHSKMETPGNIYYATPFWIGLFQKDGWLDVSANVPKIISAMQNNQISIKYQILVPLSYFRIRYPEWDSYDNTQRDEVIMGFESKLNNALTGTDKQFRSIFTVLNDDPSYAGEQGRIEIIAIDDKAKKGVWVPDSNAADAQIVQSLGLHPSQVGLSPEGGKMGAGSGSDQREAYNTEISNNTIDQQIVLEPLNYIAQFNNWGVTFAFEHMKHTTTNEQESGLIPSIP